MSADTDQIRPFSGPTDPAAPRPSPDDLALVLAKIRLLATLIADENVAPPSLAAAILLDQLTVADALVDVWHRERGQRRKVSR